MKKFLLPFFTILLLNQLCAQKEFWFELGAKGGVGLSFLTNKNILDDDNYTYRFTMMNSFGGKFAANFGPTHSIMVEGIFNNLGQDFDYVITVCDRASESCPIFPGDPARIHWSFPDPSAFIDPDEQKGAFLQVFTGLEKRLKIFLTLIDRNQKVG